MKPSRRLLLVQLVAVLGSAAAAQTPRSFDRTSWEADYAALKQRLERSYSHLAWFGSPESGVDLPALDRSTRDALQKAQSDADASAAILRFVAGFHDGHLAQTAAPTVATGPSLEPPTVNRAKDARTACAAFGFAPLTRIPFSLPFESLPGFELTSDGVTSAFRAGVIEQFGQRFGIVRIPRFRAAEFPEVCERVWSTLKSTNPEPTRRQVLDLVDREWLRTLAERLRDLKSRGATTLLVDIGGNGGGNDLGDWAVRLFTSKPVSSAPMLLSADSVAIPYFDEQLGDLRGALAPGPAGATKTALQEAIASFERRKHEATTPGCDMTWVWREQRKWGTSSCARLIESGFASGGLGYAEPGRFPETAANALYWASRTDSVRGAWDGPVYVYTNGGTGSAAEMFTALIRDRGIAKTVGSRTFGLGCGFIDLNAPFVLPHSRLAFNIPNCVRLRADGTDEVGGIAPDLPITQGTAETPRALAWRALQAIATDRGTGKP